MSRADERNKANRFKNNESFEASPNNLEPDQKLDRKCIAIYITSFFPYGFRMILSISQSMDSQFFTRDKLQVYSTPCRHIEVAVAALVVAKLDTRSWW